ncbi:MAG: hypothetical protein FJZ96_12255 [Chloroflexi bacterium]|nr:hypothetical protein [Chloroflexota bacterium]
MPSHSTILRLACICFSLLLLFFGALVMRRQALAAGGGMALAAVVLFIISSRSIEKKPLSDEEAGSLKRHVLPFLFWLASVITASLTTFHLSQSFRSDTQNRWISAGWIASILLLLVGMFWAARWRPPHPRLALAWIRSNRWEFALVVILAAASLFVRIYGIESHPYPWSGDEASIGTVARQILDGDLTNLFSTGWSGQPNWSFVPTSVTLAVFGQGLAGIRMMSVLAGTFAVLALYLFAREAFGREAALLAAGFLAAFPYHLQFSRIGVDNIMDSLMVTLVLWLIFRAARTGSVPTFALAGVASGLTIYTYVGTRLALAIAFAGLVYFVIRQKGFFKANWRGLLAWLAALVVTVNPMAWFFIKNPDIFMTRIGQEGIFLNGWLPMQVELTGMTVGQILLNQVTRTLLVFIAQNAGSNFFNSPEPYLTILGSMLFLVGMGTAFRRLFEPRYFILQGWFWSVLVFGGFLTLNPPAHTRLVMTTPAVALYLGIGLWQVATVLLNLRFDRKWILGLVAAVVVSLTMRNAVFYLGKYWTGYYFRDANGEVATEIGFQLQELDPQYSFYFFGAPRMFAGFPTIVYLAPDIPRYDLNAGSIPSLTLEARRGAFFAATPDNLELLLEVTELFPGGTWEEAPRLTQQEVLYYAYLVAPANDPRP